MTTPKPDLGKRSPHWPTVRAVHLHHQPACAACGAREKLEVHHIQPFHVRPELELEPTNLITLCEGSRACHFNLGHHRDWHKWNSSVVKDAAAALAAVIARPSLAMPAGVPSLILACLMLLFAGPAAAQYGPEASVVRLSSHGGSGTIIATGEGWSLVLSCAHCFEGRDAQKPIAIDMPHPAPGQPSRVGVKLIAVGRTQTVDLSLVRIGAGPLPYVTPVAPAGHSLSAECWSIGYDELKLPPQKRPARIVSVYGRDGNDANTILTDARPWHGRSGGALVEKRSGYLVGVVSAYSGPSNRQEYHRGSNGIYVSHAAIVRFLGKAGVVQGGPPPQYSAPAPPPQFRPQPFGQPSPFMIPGGRDCPS